MSRPNTSSQGLAKNDLPKVSKIFNTAPIFNQPTTCRLNSLLRSESKHFSTFQYLDFCDQNLYSFLFIKKNRLWHVSNILNTAFISFVELVMQNLELPYPWMSTPDLFVLLIQQMPLARATSTSIMPLTNPT